MVAFTFDMNLPSGQIYGMRRGDQVIRLSRVGSAGTTSANGIYRCELADQNGVTQTRYVGLYTDGTGRHVHREYLWQTKHTVKKLLPLINIECSLYVKRCSDWGSQSAVCFYRPWIIPSVCHHFWRTSYHLLLEGT